MCAHIFYVIMPLCNCEFENHVQSVKLKTAKGIFMNHECNNNVLVLI